MIKIISNKDNIIKLQSTKKEDFINNELIIFDKNKKGYIINCSEKEALVVMLEDSKVINSNSKVQRTKKYFGFSMEKDILGKIFNYNMESLDLIDLKGRKPRYKLKAPKSNLKNIYIDSVEFSTNIDSRSPVTDPLITGKMSIDAVLPIGKGQRQLIIGDRRTGKTFIALSAILAQKNTDVICIYVSIGNKKSDLLRLISKMKKNSSLNHTVVIASDADDTSAANFVAPYVGMSVAEQFQKEGKDILIVFDDLSKHARAYRSISLVSGLSAGREGYPGDIFFKHSKLLERSGNFNSKFNEGSITALPIIETQDQDITNYISTNVISITDGQIFTSAELFNMFQRPAINIPFSVSRVGGQAQHPFIKQESGFLKNIISQAIQILKINIGQETMSKENKKIIEKYEIFSQLCVQKEDEILDQKQQLIFLILLNTNLLKYFKKEDVLIVKKSILKVMKEDLITYNFMKFLDKEMQKKSINKDLIKYYVKTIFGTFILWLFNKLYKKDEHHFRTFIQELSKYDNQIFKKDFFVKEIISHDKNSAISLEKAITKTLNLENL